MPQVSDTSPEIERLCIDGLRRMPAWRKLVLVADMNQMVEDLAMAGLRQRHPNDSPAQLRCRLADLILGSEWAARAYGPLSE